MFKNRVHNFNLNNTIYLLMFVNFIPSEIKIYTQVESFNILFNSGIFFGFTRNKIDKHQPIYPDDTQLIIAMLGEDFRFTCRFEGGGGVRGVEWIKVLSTVQQKNAGKVC